MSNPWTAAPNGSAHPIVIAHRGASERALENTALAYETAIALGADAIEVDVRVTRDDVPICLHDPDLRRTAGSPLVARDATLAALRQAFPALPTLDEVITLAASIGIMLDIKIESEAELQALYALLDRRRDHHGIVLAVHDEAGAEAARRLAPARPRLGLIAPEAIEAFVKEGVEWVRVAPSECHAATVARVREFGARLVLITGGYPERGRTDPAQVAELLACKPDALIIDEPALARAGQAG